MAKPKSVLVVSWNESLATTREMLLRSAGYAVISALGPAQAVLQCGTKADLLVVGHSVPHSEKRKVISCFRQHSAGPVLSLLGPNQQKVPGADFGVDAEDPAVVVKFVRKILDDRV